MPERFNAGLGKRIVLDAPSAKVAAVTNQISATGPVSALFQYDVLVFQLKVTATATEAGDTLDVFVDSSLDGGATWVNVVHFAQVTGTTGPRVATGSISPGAGQATTTTDVTADAAAGTVRPGFFGDMLRVRYTIVDAVTAGNVSFTFGVTAFALS